MEAQRQLHEVQATIARRQGELALAQRHLHAFDSSPVHTPALTLIDEQTAKCTDVLSGLKEEIAHQESYKKRLRYMHERLNQQVRYLEASADLQAERQRVAHRERTLCRSRVQVESDKNRVTRQQLRDLHDKRTAFKRNGLPVLESYRDELASRLVINQRRYDADRRRDELLRFINTRTNGDSKVTSRSLSNATATISKGQTPASRIHRRDSYTVLAADVDASKRETLFAVYEGQYARVLRETGESDLNVVLERFQSHRESTARLREIEAELRVEGARLIREQQAHDAMASRLRVSGPTDVAERRHRLRDRLEGALHAQEFEKNQARERMDTQLKAFVYVQQGVLHIVELLQCLEDRPGMALIPPASLLTTARTVMGGSQPAEMALKSVAPALQTLIQLARDVGRRGLQREWLKLPALGYSMPQVARLEQFAPVGQSQRVAVAFASAFHGSTISIIKEEEADEERRDAIVMRRAIKNQEKETLRQAETILHQAHEARRLQPPPLQQRKLSSPMPFIPDAEIVAAHFREQRRTEKQENRYMNGNVLPGNRRTSTAPTNTSVATSPRRRQLN
ncbi:hypothetical protein P3T76_011347 [Phytophthora citrophthora]|uniref:Uncharacterized protein n=1 Tax=Phytophthora citrophthora TaxID=4793 RepID=A0AAD9G938_9STRA|nr:hypothetical protein P3T76_011347 [Phytophthora citrophthora]